MYMIFTWKVWSLIAAWIAVGAFVIVSLFRHPHLADVRLIVVGVQGAMALVLWMPIWRTVWKAFPQLGRWVYPDLNGTWEAQIDSNWPLVDKLKRAANHEIERFDAGATDSSSLERLTFNVKIYQSWTKIGITLDGLEGESVEVLAIPKRGGENEKHGLAYIFRQTNKTPRSTDASSFLGSAWLRIGVDALDMEGYYWTNREWNRGLNTAGLIKLVRRVS